MSGPVPGGAGPGGAGGSAGVDAVEVRSGTGAGVDAVDVGAGAGVEPLREGDREAVTAQIGRAPRGLRGVAHRCPCGLPDVVQTAPRTEDGTPFPTLYYATCPRLTSRIGTLEADGLMREQTERLDTDPDFAAAYARAHTDYLAERDAIEPLGTEVSAGGMPERVKCLHVHVAHTLARGPWANPSGDDALARLAPWWTAGPCVGPGNG